MRALSGFGITAVILSAGQVPAVFGQAVKEMPPPASLPAVKGMAEGTLGPYTAPTCVPGVPFTDITCTTGFDAWIEQFGRDGISSGCGGGNYCPGTPVTRDQMAVFIERAMRGTANWPAHTQLVWAIKASDGSPDAVASGAALLAAVAAIPTSGNDAPSSANQWLVKVGPGVFNLNGAGLSLPAWVDLDGAGQDTTTITSNNNLAYVIGTGTGGNRVSNVTLTNFNTGALTYTLLAHGTGLTLDHVSIEANGGTTASIGVYSWDSNIYVYDGAIVSFGAVGYGFYTLGSQAHSVQAWRTLFSCNSADIYNNAQQEFDLAYTRAPDALTNFGTGVFKCIGNYDFNLAPVTCP